MAHTLITSAVSWGPRYNTALNAVLVAWKSLWENDIPTMRGDRVVMVQDFISNERYRPLIAALVYHIKDSQLDEMDVEDMLLEVMEDEL